MDDSPITRLLEALDRLDRDAVAAQFTSDAHLLTVDGRRADGIEAVSEVLSEFLATLYSTSHRITAQWHQDEVWIAEVEAAYELRDRMRVSGLPRAFVAREGAGGIIADLRVYGAHERSLANHRTGEEGMWIGERWIPPL